MPVLVACFFLSGLAALVYQVAWTREFALVFGTSELAVATVLAAYMGGLALGAWLVERWLPRISRPVLVYAGLELGIAIGAVLIVPALLLASRALLVAWFGGQASPPSSEDVATSAFYLASAFVALAIPTTLMGATLPLLARHAVQERGHWPLACREDGHAAPQALPGPEALERLLPVSWREAAGAREEPGIEAGGPRRGDAAEGAVGPTDDTERGRDRIGHRRIMRTCGALGQGVWHRCRSERKTASP